MFDRDEPDTDVDRLARALALSSGEAWDKLSPYPGFLRNRFRQQARKMLGRLGQPSLA